MAKRRSIDIASWNHPRGKGKRVGYVLTMANGVMERLSNRKWRELLGRYIFGTKEAE